MDILARYGGEEFVICLPSCNQESASFVLSRLRSATPDGRTCSVGLAEWDGEQTAEHLFGAADSAMYRAKDTGRDRLVAAGSG